MAKMTKEEKRIFLEEAIKEEAREYFEEYKGQFKQNEDGDYEVNGFLLQDDIFNWGSTFNNLTIANEVETMIEEEIKLLKNERKMLIKEVCQCDPDEVIVCKNIDKDNNIISYDFIGDFNGDTEGIERTTNKEVAEKVVEILQKIGYEIFYEICEYDG